MQNINTKNVARYVLLPGIIPRAKELGSTGFGYLAFLFACVYRGVRILPPTHPFVNPSNIGKFGILQVVSAAANNIEFKRGNIDQIIVFLALLAGLVLMAMQFVLLILAIFSGRAFAASPESGPFRSMFLTEHPQTDIAFMMLDYTFGIPATGGETGYETFFGSNALAGAGPSPFHMGMHALFNFYNLAILLVAVLIFLYYVVVVVMETAETGVPFGKRFSKIYAPFRLIAAIGLLVPLNYGFNGAQYITLYAAKTGSSFATNGWILFNKTAQNPMGVDNQSLVAKPKIAAVDGLLFFSSTYHACREIYNIWESKYYMRIGTAGRQIKPYVIIDGQAQEFSGYTYEEAKKKYNNGDMEVVLGELDPVEHISYAGGVRPYCGKMTISLNFDNPANWKKDTSATNEHTASEAAGIRAIEKMYYGTVQEILRNEADSKKVWAAYGERIARYHRPGNGSKMNCENTDILKDKDCAKDGRVPPTSSFEASRKAQNTSHEALLNAYYETFRKGLDLKITDEMEKRGWGGAGIWYNAIAEINGSFTGAVYASPSVKQYPQVMEEVKKKRQMNSVSGTSCDMFEPNLSEGKFIILDQKNDTQIATALNEVYKYFACENAVEDEGGDGAGGSPKQTGSTGKGQSANAFIDAISLVFGLNGLFDIRTNSEINPATGQPIVHPLAQLSTVGKSLVENSIRSMGMAVGTAFLGGIAGALDAHLGAALQSASGMFVGIATIGLTAGFILYYILPFLPFIYFFFAVASWVKSIFEAMVGVPLWALAHLHIDGDGFSGKAAAGGYFLIFEIFLRPIVTIFGLIGGMAVFGTLAGMLNILFDFVTVNITGALPGASTSTIDVGEIESLRRGTIDQFFFTIMYAVLLYLMATSSFKMIDTIPKGIMRWIGSSVQTFNDNTGDPTSGLTRYAAIGGSQMGGQILQGVTQGAGATGQLIGSPIKAMMDEGKEK